MSDLYLMMGPPGSGKSTFLKNNVKKEDSIIISRDEIRFGLLEPGDDYFAKEKEVLSRLWKRTNFSLKTNKTVFVDQTSLTPRSRKYFLDHVYGYDTINLIWIDTDLKTCLERNELRRGTRAYVAKELVKRMFYQSTPPTLEEGFDRIFKYDDKTKQLSYIGEKI